jgi:hypothetical protein
LFEFIIDLLLDFLMVIGLRKKKKKETGLTSLKTEDYTPEKGNPGEAPLKGDAVCAGCNSLLDKGVIHENGKAWCLECYKTRVLKIKG